MPASEPDSAPMSDPTELGELIVYLARTSRLTPAEATRVVHEVLEYMRETPEEFIRRRHLQLQAQGQSNSEIFELIAHELSQRRFRAPTLTERQIRRVIYG